MSYYNDTLARFREMRGLPKDTVLRGDEYEAFCQAFHEKRKETASIAIDKLNLDNLTGEEKTLILEAMDFYISKS